MHQRRINFPVQNGKFHEDKINIPFGFPEAISDIICEVLRHQPSKDELCPFILQYLRRKLAEREEKRGVKVVIKHALTAVEDTISDMRVIQIDDYKTVEMALMIENCFRNFVEERRCDYRLKKQLFTCRPEDIIKDLIFKLEFTEEDLKYARPVIQEAYERFARAYEILAQDLEGNELLYQFFHEREQQRILLKQAKSATTIQATFRGFRVRKLLQEKGWSALLELDFIVNMRNSDGTIKLRNVHITKMKDDTLYHLGLGTSTHDLRQMYGDVRFCVLGGTSTRMHLFAKFFIREVDYQLPPDVKLEDLTTPSARFSMYKVGPVLCVNHGMGGPSISILLHELIKLMYYAKCKNPVFFRLGTCGGIGIPPGTVVITQKALDGQLRPAHETVIFGKSVLRPARLDPGLVHEFKTLANPGDGFDTVSGITVSTNDFYEGQSRLDGAFCEYTEAEKLQYLHYLKENNVMNIEMEASAFAAITYNAGIRAGVICVCLLNRLKGDQISDPKETINQWVDHPKILLTRYIRNHMDDNRS